MLLDSLDSLLHYKDPTLPQLSSLTYLYGVCLLSSFLIASDFRKPKVKVTEMSGFRSVSMGEYGRRPFLIGLA